MTTGSLSKDRIILSLISALAGGAGGRAIGTNEGETRLRTNETAIAVMQTELGFQKAALDRIERRLGTLPVATGGTP